MAGRPMRRAIKSARRQSFDMGILPQGQSTAGITMNAPVGGLNTTSPAGMMPPTDCLSLYNMIPFQYGLRVRSGYRDWTIGIGAVGAKPDVVQSVQPFTGSSDNGTRDRMFACTRTGIYDVTDEGTTPVLLYGTADGWVSNSRSGIGVSTSYVNLNGEHFLAYTDGANGYMLYREGTASWYKVIEMPTTGWVTATVYAQGDLITAGGLAYRCTTGGTSGTTAPSGSALAIADGTAIWMWVPAVSGANPGSFRHVMQWKSRLWFTSANSATARYLDVNQFAGVAHPLPFAPRFKYGGSLVGLWSWTLDGGQGVDDLLVGISRSGDVVVYQGTDPALPGAFGLRGAYWVGPVPPGRTIASDFGGDLFILSIAGCIPLSKLVTGGLIRDPNVYESAKVANLFNKLMSERGQIEGWALTQHPTDNLLVINVPGVSNGAPEQLVMSLANKGWARHRNLPIKCMTTWHGKLFFGTTDGRVCVNDGYNDSGTALVQGGEVWAYTDAGPQEIDFALLSAYQNLGSPRNKRVHMARPYFITDGTQPGYAVQARYNYDLTEIPLTDVAPVAITPSAWDAGLWDTAIWGPGVGVAGRKYGTTGMGTVVAIVLKGTSIANTTLVSIDVLLDQGGLL